MSAATMNHSVVPAGRRLADLASTVRWAPAPRFEGDAAQRWRFVAYIAGSMIGWTLAGLGLAAAIGGLISLVA